MGSGVVPVAAWFFPGPVLVAVGVALLLALLIEWGRIRLPWVRFSFLRRTRRMLRPHERAGISGATYLAAAFFIALAVFPLPVAVTAMLYASFGDAAAAIIGRRWGRHRARWGRSLEGAGAGFLVNLAAGLAVPEIGTLPAVVGALAAATLEFLPLRVDDNLLVVLGGGSALWAALALVGIP